MISPSEPIEATIVRVYVGPVERRGDRSGRLWWLCPFHDDKNPSLSVIPGRPHYRCFGCGAHGDAIDFVRRLHPGMTFGEAVRTIRGEMPRSAADLARTSARPIISDRPQSWQDFARGLVDQAEAVLWSGYGSETRRYLLSRGLEKETIRKARLGYQPSDEWIEGLYADRKVWVPCGIVIPWFDGGDVTLINIRRPQGNPRYVAVRGSHCGGLYPGRSGIVAGQPVVMVEREFDALLLGQELHGLVPVVTLGSARDWPSPRARNVLLAASPWILAVDNDEAGEKSADEWLSRSDRCVRVRTPEGSGKDWTEAHQSGLDLRACWQETLATLGHSTRSVEAEEQPSIPNAEPFGVRAEDSAGARGVPVPTSQDRSWLDTVAGWLPEWRERWGAKANAYCAQKVPTREAEARAAAEVESEMIAAGFGPPPVMDTPPRTALWRDILNEIIESGEAARKLSPSEFRRAQKLLAAHPLDADALGAVVGVITTRGLLNRCQAQDIPWPGDEERARQIAENPIPFTRSAATVEPISSTL